MLENYSELIASVQDEIDGRDDIVDKVPEWIRLAEATISREIRMVDGEYAITGTVPAANPQIVLPDRAKRPLWIQFGTAPQLTTLEIVSWQSFTAVQNNDLGGSPRAIAFVGRMGYLAPLAGAGDSYTLIYYGLPPYLSETNPVNDILIMGPDVLKYMACLFSAPYIGDDERIEVWSNMVRSGMASLKKEYWNSKASGGTLQIRNDTTGGDAHWGPR